MDKFTEFVRATDAADPCFSPEVIRAEHLARQELGRRFVGSLISGELRLAVEFPRDEDGHRWRPWRPER
jgi:hypothetical protein